MTIWQQINDLGPVWLFILGAGTFGGIVGGAIGLMSGRRDPFDTGTPRAPYARRSGRK